MIDYVDPIVPLVKFLTPMYTERIYGNTIPSNAELPVILLRNAGGSDYTRLQVLVRGRSDIEAMHLCIDVMNTLIRHGQSIDLRGAWIQKEVSPISSVDQDTNRPESWGYLRIDHIEA